MAPRAAGRWGLPGLPLVVACCVTLLFSVASRVHLIKALQPRHPHASIPHGRIALEGHQQQQPSMGAAAAAGGGAIDLAHNLTSPSPESLRRLYQEELAAVLDKGLLAWLVPEARSRLCTLIKYPSAEVALVGNGPLSDEQREAISKAHRIVRFNALQSRKRRPTERRTHGRTDLWFIRGTSGSIIEVPPWFTPNIGISREVGRRAQGIVLADSLIGAMQDAVRTSLLGRSESIDVTALHAAVEAGMQGSRGGEVWGEALARFAGALGLSRDQAQAKLLPLELGPLFDFWNGLTSRLGYTGQFSLPSTGFIGLLAVLDCLPPDGSIHIYGFNWNPKNWDGHLMQVESGFIQLLGELYSGRVVVHPTPCNDYRRCH